MSSSATNILRLEKQANGENNTTWGTKLNNLIDMVESAIAGVTTLALTNADVTLTNADYTNDQAKANVIVCTGTLSGNVNIIVPNKTKTFRVINNTSGAFTVKVKTASGTGIAITQACAAEVWCDGSNNMFYTSPFTVLGTGAPNSGSGAAASSVSVVPSGNLASTDAQSALVELQLDIDNRQPLDSDLTAIAALTPTKGNVMVGNGSAWIALGVGTNGYAHVADSTQASGTKWASLMPSATNVLMQQTSAPDGYTKQVTHNDKMIRVVSGTATSGGSVAFSTLMASQTFTGTIGGTAVSTAQLAVHNHPSGDHYAQTVFGAGGGGANVLNNQSTQNTTNAGSGSTHNHSLTMDAFNMAAQYVDVCIHQKN